MTCTDVLFFYFPPMFFMMLSTARNGKGNTSGVLQVRSVLVHGEVVLTGGEDARVCLWGDARALEEHLMAASDSGGAAPSIGGDISERHKPY
jgi:hypothetical protein